MYHSVNEEKKNREGCTVGEGGRTLERRSCVMESCA